MSRKFKTVNVKDVLKQRLDFIARALKCSKAEALNLILTPIWETIATFDVENGVNMQVNRSLLFPHVTFTFRGKMQLVIGQATTDSEVEEEVKQTFKVLNHE